MKLLFTLPAVLILAGAAIVAPQPASACPPGEGCTIPIPRPPVSGRCEKRNRMGKCIVPTRRTFPVVRVA